MSVVNQYVLLDSRGQWIYKASSSGCEDNYSAEYRCRTWNQKQYLLSYKFTFWRSYYLPPCPCQLWQALVDPDYLIEWSETCAYSANPFQNTLSQVSDVDTILIDHYWYIRHVATQQLQCDLKSNGVFDVYLEGHRDKELNKNNISTNSNIN